MATLNAVLAALTELRTDLEAHDWQPDEHERVLATAMRAEGGTSAHAVRAGLRAAGPEVTHGRLAPIAAALAPCSSPCAPSPSSSTATTFARRPSKARSAAPANGRHGGWPKGIDDDMLTFARVLRDKGTPVPEIAKKLTIKTGKNAGKNPSVASLFLGHQGYRHGRVWKPTMTGEFVVKNLVLHPPPVASPHSAPPRPHRRLPHRHQTAPHPAADNNPRKSVIA